MKIFLDWLQSQSYSEIESKLFHEAVMSDLAILQERLNSDSQLRNQFMKEPAAFLEAAGLQVPAEQARKLAQSLASLMTQQHVVKDFGQIIVKTDGR